MTQAATLRFSHRDSPGKFHPVGMLMRARLTYDIPESDYCKVDLTFYACTAAHRRAMLD